MNILKKFKFMVRCKNTSDIQSQELVKSGKKGKSIKSNLESRIWSHKSKPEFKALDLKHYSSLEH
jgi:hypothetical protein